MLKAIEDITKQKLMISTKMTFPKVKNNTFLYILIDYAITVVPFPTFHSTPSCPCLLYTSDAADDANVV